MSAQPWWRPCVAELIGVFALTAVGAGAIIGLYNWNQGSGAEHPQDATVLIGVALAHGLTIAVMVMALGHISGGHFNPAVTIAAMATRRMPSSLGLLYIVFQLVGGALGGAFLAMTLPENWWRATNLGTPAIQSVLSPARAIMVEAVLTFFLVIVIFGAAMDRRNPARALGGLAIGLTVTIDILMGGFVTGAALNPARAFGTAVVADAFANHYVYWIGPILGGLAAAFVYDLAFADDRMRPDEALPAAAPTATGPSEPQPSASTH